MLGHLWVPMCSTTALVLLSYTWELVSGGKGLVLLDMHLPN